MRLRKRWGRVERHTGCARRSPTEAAEDAGSIPATSTRSPGCPMPAKRAGHGASRYSAPGPSPGPHGASSSPASGLLQVLTSARLGRSLRVVGPFGFSGPSGFRVLRVFGSFGLSVPSVVGPFGGFGSFGWLVGSVRGSFIWDLRVVGRAVQAGRAARAASSTRRAIRSRFAAWTSGRWAASSRAAAAAMAGVMASATSCSRSLLRLGAGSGLVRWVP
jgi:hypothetical protein